MDVAKARTAIAATVIFLARYATPRWARHTHADRVRSFYAVVPTLCTFAYFHVDALTEESATSILNRAYRSHGVDSALN